MAGAGNIYRHDYEDVSAQQVWDAVQIDLPPLRAAVERELAKMLTGRWTFVAALGSFVPGRSVTWMKRSGISRPSS